MADIKPSDILQTEDGWLFLRKGSNDLEGQHTGRILLSDRDLRGLRYVLTARADRAFARAIPYLHVIVPNKETVYADRIADVMPLAPNRVVTQVERLDLPFVLVLERAIVSARARWPESLYNINNSYWNDRGAAVGYEAIMAQLQQSNGLFAPRVDVASLVFRDANRVEGMEKHLGVEGTYFEARATNLPECAKLEFTNGVTNRGRVEVWHNEAGQGTAVVFADSFTFNVLKRFLREQFAKLHLVHSATVDFDYVDEIKPDAVISVMIERFLPTIPADWSAAPVAEIARALGKSTAPQARSPAVLSNPARSLFDNKIKYKDGSEAEQIALPGHFVDFARRGDTLFVTFENFDSVVDGPDRHRFPWGYRFLTGKNFSVLGVKPTSANWYRRREFHDFLKQPELARFAAGFSRVILYGSSMGGYAALAFAGCFGKCDVLAHNPQSTLHPDLVPWEERWPEGRGQDWSGDFADAAAGARAAQRVFVSYDPFLAPDRRHVQRLDPANIVPIKVPFVGHSLAWWLHEMGVLKEIVDGVVRGDLTAEACARMARARRNIPQFYLGAARQVRNMEIFRACLRRAEELRPGDLGTTKSIVARLLERECWEEAGRLAETALRAQGEDAYLRKVMGSTKQRVLAA